MLIQFRFENHRSIREEQALTFEAAALGDEGDVRPRQVGTHTSRVLPVAALYGANASGKSNVLAALAFVREAVAYSHRMWSPDGGVPREPFAWGTGRSGSSLFEVEFILDGVRCEYGFVCDDVRFHEEWLYAWPKGRKQAWFERDGDSFKFGEHLAGQNHLVQQVTRPNALFLSAAAQLRHEQLDPVFRWFRSIRAVGVSPERGRAGDGELAMMRGLFSGSPVQQSLFGDEPSPARWAGAFLDLLRAADVGIVDVKRVEEDREAVDVGRRARRSRIIVQHRVGSDEAWLPLEEESQGTKTLFRIGPVVLAALDAGGVLVVDELEASLHPLLGLQIVKLFNDPASNPRNAQLLFSTHDTNLLGNTLGEAALRRDQVWLCEKDPEGSTRIYPLTDYKPRKAENLERGYLQGRYGAVPFLGDLVRIEAS